MIKLPHLIVGAVTVGAGLRSAYLWHQSASTEPDLGYCGPSDSNPGSYIRFGQKFPRRLEPGDDDMQRDNQAAAMLEAVAQSAKLNKAAALWSAVTAILGTLTQVLWP